MRKIYFLICLCILGLTSQAQQLLYEPFNYPADPIQGLTTQSAGAWAGINSGDSILIASGSLTYTGLPASTGNKVTFDSSGRDYYTNFASQTTGSVYSSFILNVSNLGKLSTTGGYFAGLLQGGSTSAFGATVWTRASTTTGKYNVGISTRSNSAVSWLAADLDPGTSYFIVSAYDIITGTGNDVARIWLNPSAIGGAETTADATAVAGTDMTSVARYFLRQDNVTNTPFIEIDEIRVGTTWASVTPTGIIVSPALAVGTLNSFGNACLNTTAGPNSFTITGTNLTNGDITVGPLAGYTFSVDAAGIFIPTLTLTQAGGAYSQTVYVKFTPTAVQSYNGNIPVSGGGVTTATNVAASGSGVSTAPTVTTGAASAITFTTATAAGSITDAGCTAVTAYGIEYSTTQGFAGGTGTKVAATNLSGTSFSADLSGLTQGTTYYYRAYATNAGGTAYGTELSFPTATPDPSITTTTLSAFGNVCLNTPSNAGSFTISGSNLTAANVTVGPLAGFSFATTSSGTYTSSLTLAPARGAISQVVYVKFTPTTAQSYNGDIPVSGGGVSTTVNVAASGAGVNTPPAVDATTPATAVTQTSATVPGTITSNGCTTVTAYGIEYSTTTGFVNGTGTKVPSSNLSGTGFTSALSGLTPSTTYYYKVYATNAGGTTYSAQQTFTTQAPPPPAITVTPLAAFSSTCLNTPVGPNSFTITGVNLTTSTISVGPLAGYSFATTATGTYAPSLTLAPAAGAINQTIYVKFTPTVAQSYNGNIPVTGGGVTTTVNVAATATGVNTTPTVVTGNATNVTTTSAVLAGSITANGCSNVTSYGIEYSGINNFDQGTGTKIESKNLSGNNFSVAVSNLVQGATYNYRAYAVNAGGIAYGPQQTFTVTAIQNTFVVYPNPVSRGRELRFSTTNLSAGYHGVVLYNSAGTKVFEKGFNVQVNFINDRITVPFTLTPGVYWVQLISNTAVIGTKTILVF